RGFSGDEALLRTTALTAANLELRTPLTALLRMESHKTILPIDAIAFSDYARLRAPDAFGASRQFWSAGAGVRVNAAGFIFEFDGVRELQPASGWRFVVNFLPGF